MRSMAANLDPEKSADADTVVGFRFPDVSEEYTLHVRRGVAELQPHFPSSLPDMTVTVDSTVWKEILARKRNAAAAIASGEVGVEGGRIELARFLLMFR
jgi:alkyl sulfatase BDS1-like metallo-beta-lactamase superfamily hydrolase